MNEPLLITAVTSSYARFIMADNAERQLNPR